MVAYGLEPSPVFNHLTPKLMRFAVSYAAFDSSARQPYAEAIWMMMSTISASRVRRTPEPSGPDHPSGRAARLTSDL
jgi:hypothetical protein